jgi:hypothetical protein
MLLKDDLYTIPACSISGISGIGLLEGSLCQDEREEFGLDTLEGLSIEFDEGVSKRSTYFNSDFKKAP